MAKQIHYADSVQPDFGIPWVPVLSEERLRQMTVEQLQRYRDARKYVERRNEENPVGAGWTLPIWPKVMANWKKANFHVVLGGNQCVSGDTWIYDPVSKCTTPISEIEGPFHVEAWDVKSGKVVWAEASKPFTKGEEEMFDVRWHHGGRKDYYGHVRCTSEHKIMACSGQWVHVKHLKVGDRVMCPEVRNKYAVIWDITPAGKHEVWDITVPNYGNYLQNGIVHSNSGKTTLGARMTVWAAATIPEAEVYCFHVSEKRSIDDQQRFVYESLPNTIKAIQTKKGIHHSLQYSQKNGFTDSICILPPHPGHYRGGSINFYNYQQYQQNDQIIEGIKAHMVWADEKLPLALLETLKYRLFTYHGRLLLTYTVIDGWNDTIEKILAKTKTIEKVWCDDPRINGYVPVIQESLSMESTLIYYAHTQDNPFTDYKEFLRLNKNADKATFLARAFGVPTKSIAGVFPGFNRDINVIPHEQLPWIKIPEYPVTRYMALDPGGSKHWFMLWVSIDARNTWWVYREWPDRSHGDWALPGNKDGPAQKGTNKGIRDYVELIRDLEGSEKIMDRIIDPRAGAAERQAKDGATNIISDLDDEDMVFHPAPGGSSEDGKREIDDGIQMITNLLSYDQSKPVDSVNSPRIYFSDQCQNTIFSMAEYTSKLGQGEATKDPIDCLRYLRKAGCEFLDTKQDLKAQRSTGVY